MLKKLYLDNGYINFDWIVQKNYPFTFLVGAKSIGKTYNALLYAIEHNIKFIYMRRTQTQLDAIKDEEDSPLKAINIKTKYNIQPKPINKSLIGFYHAEFNEEEQKDVIHGKLIGYGIALSTFQNISSVGFNDVDLLIYDEFIPMRHERSIKDESMVFFKLLDNISRNRELEGRKHLIVWCLANPDRLDNALFLELGLTDIARKHKSEIYTNDEMGVLLIQPLNSPISEKKKETTLYKLTKNTKYYKLAIENKFDVDDSLIRSLNLEQFNLICMLDVLCFYKHKSENIYYVTKHIRGECKNKYLNNTKDIKAFKNKYSYILKALYKNKLYFENYECLSIYMNNVKI